MRCVYNCCELHESTHNCVCRSVQRSMAAVQLLTAVVLNFMQIWQTCGQGKKRAFLVAIKYLVVMSKFTVCNSTRYVS